MRKWIIAAFIIAALAGCKSTETQDAAPVEDRAAHGVGPGDDGRRHDVGRDHRVDQRDTRRRCRRQRAEGSERTSCRSATSISITTSTSSRTSIGR